MKRHSWVCENTHGLSHTYTQASETRGRKTGKQHLSVIPSRGGKQGPYRPSTHLFLGLHPSRDLPCGLTLLGRRVPLLAGLGRPRDRQQSAEWSPACPRSWRTCWNRIYLWDKNTRASQVPQLSPVFLCPAMLHHCSFIPVSAAVHLSEVSAQSLSLKLLKEDSIGAPQWLESNWSSTLHSGFRVGTTVWMFAGFPGSAQNYLLPTMLSSKYLVPLSDEDTLIFPDPG